MSILAYLVPAVTLLIIAVVNATLASGENAGLRWHDLGVTPRDDVQHQRLGHCVEWSAKMVSHGWTLVVAFSALSGFFALVSLGPIGLLFSFGAAVFSRYNLREVRARGREYVEIQTGNLMDPGGREIPGTARIAA